MKKFKLALGFLLLLSFLPFNVLAQGSEPPIPPAPIDGSVVLDTLNWLSSAQEAEINSINKKLDDDGIAQMAVVTLDDCGGDKVKFRNDLFRAWGIGHKNDNDGLLIMVCWYGGDPSRRSVEQTTGLGMEGFLPDELTSKIAKRTLYPLFSRKPTRRRIGCNGKGICRHPAAGYAKLSSRSNLQTHSCLSGCWRIGSYPPGCFLQPFM